MKNLVIMPAFKKEGIEYEPYVRRCAESWMKWCEKHGHDFVFWDEPVHSFSVMTPTFQKTAVFQVLDSYNCTSYDQYSVVDYDTFILPWADDYFKLTNNEFAAVLDGGYAPPLNRSIQMVKENWFLNSTVTWGNYFNSGFITFGLKHREVFQGVYDFYGKEHTKWLQCNKSPDMTDEQTVMNFVVRDKGFPVTLLPRDYNILDTTLMSFFQNYTDELGREINAEKTFRTAAKMVHLTQGKDFRNQSSDWLTKLCNKYEV